MLSLLGASSLIFSSVAQAEISNESFEDNPAFLQWQIIGDVSRQDIFQGISSPDGNFQALLTTATTNLLDDQPSPAGTFNFSGNNPANENFASDLENFLGLTQNSLDIPINGPFGATQGSGVRQTFSAKAGDRIQFAWNFLTNDNSSPFFGGARDYGFVSLNPVAPQLGNISTVLADSISPSLNSSTTNFSQETGYSTFTSAPLSEGEYVLALGVVDGAGTDKTSALLVDNFDVLSEETFPISIIPPSELFLDDMEISTGIFGLDQITAVLESGEFVDILPPADINAVIGDVDSNFLFDAPISTSVLRIQGGFDAINPDKPRAEFDLIVGPFDFSTEGTPAFTYYLPAMTSNKTYQVTSVGEDLELADNENYFLNDSPLGIVSSVPSGVEGEDFIKLSNGISEWFVTLSPDTLQGKTIGPETFRVDGVDWDVPHGTNPSSSSGNPDDDSGDGDPDDDSGDGDPGDGSGDGDPGDGSGDGDPGDGSGDGDPGDGSGDGDPGDGSGDGDPDDDSGDGDPDDDSGDGEPDDGSGDGEPDDDSGDGEPDGGSGDGEPDDDSGDGEPDGENIVTVNEPSSLLGLLSLMVFGLILRNKKQGNL